MKQKIKIKFSDFWRGFEDKNNYFYNLLAGCYEVEISDKPDFLFYSTFGTEYRKYDCVRIFYTGENWRPNFAECDYAFSFDYLPDNPRNYRLPLYALYGDCNLLLKPKPSVEEVLRGKRHFCNFICSNKKVNVRNAFFLKLSKYKKIDSGGKAFNSLSYLVKNKLEFIRHYKFTITFENSSYPGYTTEKLFHPMLVHSLPIYWGNPLVCRDFNAKSFINCHDYRDFDEVIERIIAADRDDAVYAEYLANPYFNGNQLNEFVRPENALQQLDYIFNTSITPVSSSKPTYIKLSDQDFLSPGAARETNHVNPCIGFNDLKVGQKVKVKGKPGEDGAFVALEVKLETEIGVKATKYEASIDGLIRSIDFQTNMLHLLNREFVLPDNIEIKDLHRNIIGLKDLKAGDRVKFKGKYSDLDGFVIEKIKMQETVTFTMEELQGEINKIDREKKSLEVIGFTVMVNEKTEIR